METAEQTRTTNQKNDRLNLRLSEEQRSILDEAAAACGMTVGTFVLSHATEAARNLLADRTGVVLSEERWNNFVAMLDHDLSTASRAWSWNSTGRSIRSLPAKSLEP
jgi:uncharacterized protein (DUF1778 family)